MTEKIPINLVVEDALSEAVLRKILLHSLRPYSIGACYGKRGYGYIKNRVEGFNKAARLMPYLILSDLEETCPSTQISSWMPNPPNPNLIFRIAVEEIESWILADHNNFAKFIGVHKDRIERDTDRIPDPKRYLIDLARSSRFKNLKRDIVPQLGSTASIGRGYNIRLSEFVEKKWDPHSAVHNSTSLLRAIRSIDSFNPIWESPEDHS